MNQKDVQENILALAVDMFILPEKTEPISLSLTGSQCDRLVMAIREKLYLHFSMRGRENRTVGQVVHTAIKASM